MPKKECIVYIYACRKVFFNSISTDHTSINLSVQPHRPLVVGGGNFTTVLEAAYVD